MLTTLNTQTLLMAARHPSKGYGLCLLMVVVSSFDCRGRGLQGPPFGRLFFYFFCFVQGPCHFSFIVWWVGRGGWEARGGGGRGCVENDIHVLSSYPYLCTTHTSTTNTTECILSSTQVMLTRSRRTLQWHWHPSSQQHWTSPSCRSLLGATNPL